MSALSCAAFSSWLLSPRHDVRMTKGRSLWCCQILDNEDSNTGFSTVTLCRPSSSTVMMSSKEPIFSSTKTLTMTR